MCHVYVVLGIRNVWWILVGEGLEGWEKSLAKPDKRETQTWKVEIVTSCLGYIGDYTLLGQWPTF